MFCIKCGKRLTDDAEFCYSCGTKVYHPKSPHSENGRIEEGKLPEFEKDSNHGCIKKVEGNFPENTYPGGKVINKEESLSLTEKIDNDEKSDKKKNLPNKKFIIIFCVVLASLMVLAIVLFAGFFIMKKKDLGNDAELNDEMNENSFMNHYVVEDRTDDPIGYNPDIFEYCGYDSNVLGKSLNEVISTYGLYVANTKIVRSEEQVYSLPICAREGQTVVLAIDRKKSPSPTYSFILDNDVVIGLVFLDVGGFQNISKYVGDLQVAPRKVKISSGMTNAQDILCWRLTNGYRFIFSSDIAGQTCALGYADIVDPTQCYDYTNLIYNPIKELYSDKKDMPDWLFNDMRGIYLNPDNNVFLEIDSPDCICRSLINGEYGEKDYFYLDRFDSYEEVGPNKYLIKVKCGDTKLSYLSVDEYNGDGTGHQTLYLNSVDEWTYNDNYIKNAKYCFYRDFTYDTELYNSSVSDSDNTVEVQHTSDSSDADDSMQANDGNYNDIDRENVWKLDYAKEGELPNEIYEEIKGIYESEINGIQITVLSPSQILWESGTFQTTETIEACEAYGEELLIYTSIDGAPIILSVFHSDNDEIGMCTLEGGGWDYSKAHVHTALGRISKDIDNELN